MNQTTTDRGTIDRGTIYNRGRATKRYLSISARDITWTADKDGNITVNYTPKGRRTPKQFTLRGPREALITLGYRGPKPPSRPNASEAELVAALTAGNAHIAVNFHRAAAAEETG